MNLQEISHNKKDQRGFTLIELLLVVALMFIIGGMLFPLGISFYRSQVLDETREGIVSALRSAQSFSRSGKNESSFGVKVLEEAYIIFQGNSYTARVVEEDGIFPIPSSVTHSGFDEVVFSALRGEPNVVGVLNITLEDKETSVEILPSGNIE